MDARPAPVGGAAQAEEIKLRWGHYLPNSGFVQVEKNFTQKIEERTNGRVKIEITFAGGLGKGPEVAVLAGRGAIDMASVGLNVYVVRSASPIPLKLEEVFAGVMPFLAIDILTLLLLIAIPEISLLLPSLMR